MRNKIKPFVVEIKKSKRGKTQDLGVFDAPPPERPNMAWPDLAEVLPQRRIHAAADDLFAPVPVARPADVILETIPCDPPERDEPIARVLWVSGFEDPVEVLLREDGERRGKRGRKPADATFAKSVVTPRRDPKRVRAVRQEAPSKTIPPALPAIRMVLTVRPVEAVARNKRVRAKELPRGERWKMRRLPRHCW